MLFCLLLSFSYFGTFLSQPTLPYGNDNNGRLFFQNLNYAMRMAKPRAAFPEWNGLTPWTEPVRTTPGPIRLPCRTTRNEPGFCMELRECPNFRQWKAETTFNSITFLPLIYGYCGMNKYCCPGNGGNKPLIASVSPKRTTTTTTRRTTTTTTTTTTTGVALFDPWPEGADDAYDESDPADDNDDDPRSESMFSTTTSLAATTRAPTFRTGQSSTPTVRHRNRHLLPEGQCGVHLQEKIMGGTQAGIQEFPWMALLQYNTSSGPNLFACGGSLISERYVLTAAHCLKIRDPETKLTLVRLGEFNLRTIKDCLGGLCNPPVQDIAIEEIRVHANYSPTQSSQYNDIGLIRLAHKANISQGSVNPICLPLDGLVNKSYRGQSLTVAGWGKTSNEANSGSNTKLKLVVPVVDMNQCALFYARNKVHLTDVSQMCAGGVKNKDSCNGDSGGALMSTDLSSDGMRRWHLTGIVSLGSSTCGRKGIPGVYTKVSAFIDWILSNMRD